MTKPITSVAAMQLVEQGKLKLDEPASTYIKELGSLQVLQGFDPKTGKPILKPATKPVTLRTLLTHTSGFAYDTWFAGYGALGKGNRKRSLPLGTVAPLTPLMFEPGSRWQYGTSADWSGRLVETVSGLTLEAILPEKHSGTAGHARHQLPAAGREIRPAGGRYPTGNQTGRSRKIRARSPQPPKAFNGGGGLYSTAPDYVRFMQMILRRGKGADGAVILQPKTVDMMATIQTGDLSAGKLKTARPGYFERRRFSSRLQRWIRVRLPDQFGGVRRRALGRQPGVGRNMEHLLLDRSEERRGRRDHDAVSAIRRQRSGWRCWAISSGRVYAARNYQPIRSRNDVMCAT